MFFFRWIFGSKLWQFFKNILINKTKKYIFSSFNHPLKKERLVKRERAFETKRKHWNVIERYWNGTSYAVHIENERYTLVSSKNVHETWRTSVGWEFMGEMGNAIKLIFFPRTQLVMPLLVLIPFPVPRNFCQPCRDIIKFFFWENFAFLRVEIKLRDVWGFTGCKWYRTWLTLLMARFSHFLCGFMRMHNEMIDCGVCDIFFHIFLQLWTFVLGVWMASFTQKYFLAGNWKRILKKIFIHSEIL